MPEERPPHRLDGDTNIVTDMKLWARVEFSTGAKKQAENADWALPLSVDIYDDREPEHSMIRFGTNSKVAGPVCTNDAGYAFAYRLTADLAFRRSNLEIQIEDLRFNAIRFGRPAGSRATFELLKFRLNEIENIDFKFYFNGLLMLAGSTGKLKFEETDDKSLQGLFSVSAIHRFGIGRNFLGLGLRSSVPIEEICRGLEQYLGFASVSGAHRRVVCRGRPDR